VVRLLHFMFTGGLAGLLQIYLLMVFTHYGWPPVAASATAALLGAQLNFMLSSLITWRDRPAEVLWRRWLLYQGSIVGTMALSVLVFSLLHTIYPAVMASAGGILAGGIANFILGNHLVFRKRLPAAAMHDQARQQTLVT
jgi:putative flippase GtrA